MISQYIMRGLLTFYVTMNLWWQIVIGYNPQWTRNIMQFPTIVADGKWRRVLLLFLGFWQTIIMWMRSKNAWEIQWGLLICALDVLLLCNLGRLYRSNPRLPNIFSHGYEGHPLRHSNWKDSLRLNLMGYFINYRKIY